MKSARDLRAISMASASTMALLPAAAYAAGRQPQLTYTRPSQQAVAGTFISLEGGLACQFGDRETIHSGEQVSAFGGVDTLPELARANFNGNDCGWTGRIGFGQDHIPLLGGLFDSWAIFGRHTDFGTHHFKGTGAAAVDSPYTVQNSFTGKSDADHTVIDFEVGRNIGIGTGVRAFGGLRYARFEENASLTGSLLYANGYYSGVPSTLSGFGAKITNTFQGIGPRIGLTSRARFGGGFGIIVSGSASALFGDLDSKVTATHGASNIATTTSHLSSSGWVTNYEAEAALTLQTSIKGEFALGARVESWHGETKSNLSGGDCVVSGHDQGCTRYTAGDRLNWGPFARWKLYLD